MEYTIRNGSKIVNYDENFVSNLSKAIINVREEAEAGGFDPKLIKEQAERFSAEGYYHNFVRLIEST